MYKVISCGIFQPYIEYLGIDKSQYEFVYLKIQQHNQPNQLAKAIQLEIDQSKNFKKIIILYGICGGALLSLRTHNIPLVVIKTHDCMKVLLGSNKRYKELTHENKSILWSCYSLKKDNYVNDNLLRWKALYDEETIEYLKSILLKTPSLYISLDIPLEKNYLSEERNIILGDLKYLEQIIKLCSNDIMYVYPQQKIKQTIDQNLIEIVYDD